MNFRCIMISILLYSNTYTQPVINYDNFFDFNKRYIKTIFFAPYYNGFVSPDIGNNILWDYSFVRDIPELFTFYDTLYFVNPVNTPFYQDPQVDYKRANICLVESVNFDPFDFENYFYYITSPTEINFIGSWADDLSNERYWYNFSDTRMDYKFPLYYSINIVDSFKSKFHDMAVGLWIYSYGTTKIIGDGYGTIITPSKDTILNALKLTYTLEGVDSCADEVYHVSSKKHIWFSKDKKGPIIIIEETFKGYISAVEEYKQIIPTNIKNPEEALLHPELSIYPNPVISEASISLPENASVDVLVYNINGQVRRKYNKLNTNLLLFQCENLPSGIYFLCVAKNNKILYAKKFLILK